MMIIMKITFPGIVQTTQPEEAASTDVRFENTMNKAQINEIPN